MEARSKHLRDGYQYEAPLGPLWPCGDCDRHMRDCICDDVLRCSCGIPDEICVCAGKMS